ncbi:hypothetical protein IPA_01020 [Ignicoccus pacificus DSM 13166]|uniref:Uncharacterized protein n=1 Tax=Ignicoccus pacificus DSM 13166 TaxID=940294 RepID=A0A977KBG9_9CREN|nr:hypothetical protein IPA_01020 [Ignicoccus pacificus DSM 13166]
MLSLELVIRVKFDDAILNEIERNLEEGKNIVIKLEGLNAEFKVGSKSNEEIVYYVSKEGIRKKIRSFFRR